MKHNTSKNAWNVFSRLTDLHISRSDQWQKIGCKCSFPYLTSFFIIILAIIVYSCSPFATLLFAYIALAVVFTFWIVIIYPRLAVLLVFLCAGIPSLQLYLPGHTVRPVELALLLCIVIILLFRPHLYLQITHVIALLFLAVAFISFLHMPEISTNATVFGANKRLYNLLTILLALFCGSFMARYIANLSSFLVAVSVSNIPLYLISLAQAFKLPLPLFLSPDQNPALTGDGGRLVGPFDGAATFGIYLTGLFAVSLSCALLGMCRRDRLIGTIMVLASLTGLIGSGTRSALIAIGIMLFVALAMTQRLKLSFGVLIFALSGLIAFPSSILSHFTHAETSTSNRLFLWKEAIQLIIAHPWIGIGLEQFHYYYSRLIISQSTQLNPHGISVHNQYLEWAMEGGVLWAVLGMLFLSSLIIFCQHNYFVANHCQRALLLATMLAATATIITGFFDVPFDNVEGAVFFCMLAGLSLGKLYHHRIIYPQRSFPNKFLDDEFGKRRRGSAYGMLCPTSQFQRSH